MDRPRRALLEEPEEVAPAAPRRSGGFVPEILDDGPDDDTIIRPLRPARAAPNEDRPRRAAAPLEPEDDDEPDEEPQPRGRRALPDPELGPKPELRPEPEPRPEPVEEPRPEPELRPEPVEGPPPEPELRPTTSAAPMGGSGPVESSGLLADRRSVAPIVIDRLVKSYDGHLAVRNLTFSVPPARVTAFLGPNGAGKTTTLRILVGLVTANTGTATFGTTAYAQLPNPTQTVGCVLDAHTHPARTGRNHLRVLAPPAGASDRRVDELLEALGLTAVARRPTEGYSLGMRQRLALAAALLGDPDYLVLDEPATGLDADGVRWLRGFLREFAASGRTVLLSSHLLHEVQAIADEIVVINEGRLVAQVPLSELDLGRGVVRARVADLDAAARLLVPLDAQVERAHDERGPFLRVHTSEVSAVGAALFGAGVAVHELTAESRDLEAELVDLLRADR